MAERVGASIRRAPYVWFALTLVVFLLMLRPAWILVASSSEEAPIVGWAAAGLIAYGVISWIVLLPRMRPRPGKTLTRDFVAAISWAYACTPFLVGVGALALDAPRWVLGLGFVTSVALLVSALRRVRRPGPASAA